MKILVTGSAGMIGSALSEALLEAGHELLGVDRQLNVWSARVEDLTLHIDLTDNEALSDLPASDVVVHLAANARVHELVLDPARALENIQSTFQALEHARRSGARFIFASSREVYGNQPGRERYAEGDVDLSVVESPYSASKLSGEALTRAYGNVYGIPWTIVRFSNVYGRNDLSERFIPIAFRRALEGTRLTIYGRDKRLDFTYLDDAIAGLLAIIERSRVASGQVFNVSGGAAHSLIETAQLVAAAVDLPLETVIEEPRPGEVIAYEADLGQAERLLDYRPQVPLDRGIELAAEWYRMRSGRPPGSTAATRASGDISRSDGSA
jgi:nucleoside-diphosphate-sugar epimerase